MSKYIVTQYDIGETYIEADNFGVIEGELYLTNAQGKSVAAFKTWLSVVKASARTAG